MTTEHPVRVAIVGCGAITASYHLPAALRSAEVELCGLVDVDIGRAAALRRRYGLTCPVLDNVQSLLERVDGVLVATPNHTHRAVAEEVLTCGIPVLIEKPMVTTHADALHLCEVAERNRTFIAVGYRSRHYASVRLLKHLLETRYFGRLFGFHYEWGSATGWSPVSGFNLTRRTAGGGILLDTHVFDKILYWFGEPRDFRYADDSWGGVESTCRAELAFDCPDGPRTGLVFLSKALDLRNKLILDTEKYRCELPEQERDFITLFPKESPDIELRVRDNTLHGLQATEDDFQIQLEAFAENVRGRRAPIVDGRAGARCIRLIESMYERRRQLEEPWAAWKRVEAEVYV